MKDKFSKALALRESGGIQRDELGNYYVPSASTEGKIFIVSVSGNCNCPAMTSICSHNLATTYLDALLAIFTMRYAESLDYLQAVVDTYSDSVEAMPAKIRVMVRAEHQAARGRISGSIQDAYETRVIKEGKATVMVVSRQEAASDYGAVAIT